MEAALVPWLALAGVVLSLVLGGIGLWWLNRRLNRQDERHDTLRRQLRNFCRILVTKYREQKRALADQRERLDRLSGLAQAHGELGEAVKMLAQEVGDLRAYAEHQAQLLQTLYLVLGQHRGAPPGLGADLNGKDLPLLPRSVAEFGAPTVDYSLEAPVVNVPDGISKDCVHDWQEVTVRTTDDVRVPERRGAVEAVDYCGRCTGTRTRRIR